MAGKIGILAGGGDLPLTVAARLQGEGRPFHVIRLAEFADDRLARYPNDVLPMGAFGGVQKALKRAGCDTICLAGHVARPDFRFLAKDLKAISVVPSLVAAATRGDDALLRAVIKVFEDEGFGVVGADQLLGGETRPAGALGASPRTPRLWPTCARPCPSRAPRAISTSARAPWSAGVWCWRSRRRRAPTPC